MSSKRRRDEEAQDAELISMQLQKAEAGDPEAQYTYAQMLHRGVPSLRIHIPTAMVWYQRAADTGHAEACHELSIIHHNYGDSKMSLTLLIKAAECNHGQAQVLLGVHYCRLSSLDMQSAIYWFRRAAANEIVDGYYNLGYLYEHGVLRIVGRRGVVDGGIDTKKAQECYDKARRVKVLTVNTQAAAVVVAHGRANVSSPFRDSVLDNVSSIMMYLYGKPMFPRSKRKAVCPPSDVQLIHA
jgi:TPR repeat protein